MFFLAFFFRFLPEGRLVVLQLAADA